MDHQSSILQQFEPITLTEMDRVKLMDRTDTKFTFTIDQFENILKEVKQYYRVLEVNGIRLNRYKTLYYDTPRLDLYYQHHNGKLNRYKIRHRTYVESDTGFLEIKFKNNKGRTIKCRIKEQNASTTWEGESRDFLIKSLPFAPQTLIPVLWVNYGRYTLVHKEQAERLTIDVNLEFVRDSITKKLNGLVIAEVKQDKRITSPFVKMMKKYHIREGSISKYCMGIAFTWNEVKKNNFKQKLLTIQNITYHDTATTG